MWTIKSDECLELYQEDEKIAALIWDEVEGSCDINDHYLDIKLSPKEKSRSYELEVTYTVADSTRKARIEVEVI